MPLEETGGAETTLVVLTAGGFIKRVDLAEFDAQRRGGKGVVGAKPGEEDVILRAVQSSGGDRVLCFTSLGMCHRLESTEIPVMSRYARGKKAASLLEPADGEHVTYMLTYEGEFGDENLVLISSKGVIKRTALSNFKRMKAGGTKAMSLAEGDVICGGYVSATAQDAVIVTSSAKVVRCEESDVRVMGKTAQGVRGVKLAEGDSVVAACPAYSGTNVLIVTERGFGKLTAHEEFRKTSRGAGGVTGSRLADKTGKVAFAATVGAQDVILFSRSGKFIRFPASDVRETGRAAVGVRLMRMEEPDAVAGGVVVTSG
ncbi:MAG: DNA gyrase C-terminal beta-propeller domain-containing protein [Candidatus Eisenbacteria bacterium]